MTPQHQPLAYRLINYVAPWHLVVVIIAASFLGTQLSPFWSQFLRFLSLFTIITILGRGFVHYGLEAQLAREENRLGREELRLHRMEIIEGMRRREEDIVALQRRSIALAEEAAALALAITQAAQAANQVTDVKIAALGDQVAAGTAQAARAYHEANSVNEKMSGQQQALEALNQRLIEQSDQRQNDEQTSLTIDTINKTTKESHTILVENVAVKRAPDETLEGTPVVKPVPESE